MILSSIRLANFRNYEQYQTSIAPLTILIGANGIGKTNILESIVMLSTTKSHRTSRDRDLIRVNEETSRIEGNIQIPTGPVSLAIAFSTNPAIQKTYFKDSKVSKGTELVGQLKTVLFSPETMELVYGSPSIRRRFLNSLLCQIDPKYIHSLWSYSKIIQERNKLLFLINQNHAAPDELEFWNDQLISHGSNIINARDLLIKYLNEKLTMLYQEVSGQNDKLTIIYQPSVTPDKFAETLKSHLNREVRSSTTLFGPHRDDFQLCLNNNTLVTYGSRGEARSAILALKIGEILFHESSHNQKPILLLDDIFSELDQARRERLNDLVGQTQTIITATEIQDLNPKSLKKALIINLSQKIGGE